MAIPKVSIIMPVYNAAKYLDETIKSILNQTYNDFEFLIIDDGSTDNSLEILYSYNDPRIKILKNEKNIGYVKTLNKLIDLSKGEYIARQDNDDISLPDRIEKQVLFLNMNKDVGVCGTNAFVFGKKTKMTRMPITDDEIKAYMILYNPMLHPTIMYRKSIFEVLNIGKYNEDLCPAEDYAMWFEISKKTKLANLPEPLLKYRWHENNTSQLKKNIQIEKANHIRKEILDYTISYQISTEESKLFEIMSNPKLANKKDLKSVEDTLTKILIKNRVIGYYNNSAITNLFFYFWTKIFLRSQKLTFSNKFSIYIKSNLFTIRGLFSYIRISSIKKLIYDKNI
ncbi:MAG: glycosyltransferase [Bacilli bacterium]|nr:glycosyltransferase [Bacilli bacterium]